jgi:hypothetical protein
MNVDIDSQLDASPYIRSDVSFGVLIALLISVGAGIVYHWSILTLTFALAYMTVGLATVYEWNTELQAEGKAPFAVFANIRAASFMPTLLAAVSLHFAGVGFAGVAGVSLSLIVGYLFTLYAVGFAGIEADRVHFEPDPYTGEKHAWKESVYIPLLEKYSLEQADNN